MTLTVPGTASQVVAVRATGGNLHLAIHQDTVDSSTQFYVPYVTSDRNIGSIPAIEWVFVAAPGTHTYTRSGIATETAGPLAVAQSAMIATSHSFGTSGDAGAAEIDPTAAPDPCPGRLRHP